MQRIKNWLLLRKIQTFQREFHQFLARIWPEVEALVIEHKLVNVYLDRIEAFR